MTEMIDMIFEKAWAVVKEDASEYCDDVFGVMESHDMGFFEAVMAVARLVGVKGADLHRACVARMDQMEKADGGMTSSTSGTMNPRHGPDSPGEPTGLKRLQRRSRGARKRAKFPPGYEKGGVLDPNKQKPRHQKEKPEEDKPDHEALLEENRKMTGNMAAKSVTNLLYGLGLLRKDMFGPDFFDPLRGMKQQAMGDDDYCEECGMPKRNSLNSMMFADGEMCDC